MFFGGCPAADVRARGKTFFSGEGRFERDLRGTYDKIINNADLTLPGNYVLPVRFSRVLFREYVSEPDPDCCSEEQLLTDAVLLQIRHRMHAGMILSNRLEVHPVQDGTKLTGTVECREEIGVAKDIQD